MVRANDDLGIAPPRRPWPDPLPADVRLADVDPHPVVAPPGARPVAPLGLADDPSRQRHLPSTWDGAAGNLLLYGVAGSGTTTALVTLARSLARRHRPTDLHLYALDFGAGGLARLADLPHVGAVVSAGERERQFRLLRHLRAELTRRLAAGRSEGDPGVVLLLDNWSGFAAAFDDLAGLDLRDEVTRLVADGPAVGLWTVVAADQPNAVPSAVADLVPSKLVFRLAERDAARAFGLGSTVGAGRPGRAWDTATGLEVQVALAGADLPFVDGPRAAPPIGVLPVEVALADVVAAASPGGDGLFVPLGLADATLAPGGLRFRDGDHATVSGPTRSGKSTALLAVARALAGTRPDVVVRAVAPRPGSPLRAWPGCGTSAADLAGALVERRPQVVLVDDAEAVDDPTGELAAVLASHRPDLHVVAAGRADALRGAYGHWTRDVRRSRLGLALQPEPEDGDLFGATLPRRDRPASLAGRGYLVVDGRPDVFQVARP